MHITWTALERSRVLAEAELHAGILLNPPMKGTGIGKKVRIALSSRDKRDSWMVLDKNDDIKLERVARTSDASRAHHIGYVKTSLPCSFSKEEMPLDRAFWDCRNVCLLRRSVLLGLRSVTSLIKSPCLFMFGLLHCKFTPLWARWEQRSWMKTHASDAVISSETSPWSGCPLLPALASWGPWAFAWERVFLNPPDGVCLGFLVGKEVHLLVC